VFKVSPGRRAELNRLLASWEPDGAGPDALGFGAVETLHFASVTIFEREFLDPLLAIECNFDGKLDTFLADFAAKAGGLIALLNCRLGPAVRTPREAAEALRAAVVRPSARHIGALGLSRKEILASEALVGAVREHLCAHQTDLSQLDAPAVAATLQQAFKASCPPLAPRRTLPETIAAIMPLAVVAVGIPAVLLWACFAFESPWPLAGPLLAIAVAAAVFLWSERREPVRKRPEAGDDLGARKENRPGAAQNHFSSLAPLKTGPVRWASRLVFMWLLDQLARVVFTKGKLGEIPSIHFAHWAVVDQGSSLVFFSNYGGTWESYLDDFIQKAANGLTGVWSHCQGFPASRWLVGGGARDERAFKQYARDTQAAEALWFSAYPTLTARRINNNRAIVEALAGQSREPPARWLARI